MSENRRRFSVPLLLLTLSHGITDLSQGALPVLLPLLKGTFGLSYAQVGIIVMMQNFTSSIIQPAFGYISDRLALPWLIPLGVLLAGVGLALTGLVNSYYLLLAIVVITGLGVAAFHPQGAKGAHHASSPERRGQNMAIFSVGGHLGATLGTILMALLLTMPGTLSNTVYLGLPAIITSGLLWLNLAKISPAAPAQPAAAKTSDRRGPLPYLLIGVLLSFIFFRSAIAAGLSTYIPLYYVDYLAGSPAYAGYLLSVYSLTGVAGTYIGGTLSDRLGRKTVIILSLLVSWPLIALLPYTSGTVTFALMAVLGLTLVATSSPTLVLAQEMMPGYEAMAAGLTTGFSIGLGGVGALLLGYVADNFGMPSVFTVLAALPLAAMAIGALLPGRWFRRETA